MIETKPPVEFRATSNTKHMPGCLVAGYMYCILFSSNKCDLKMSYTSFLLYMEGRDGVQSLIRFI